MRGRIKRAQKDSEIFKEKGQRHEQNVQLTKESEEIISRLGHGFQQFVHNIEKWRGYRFLGKMMGPCPIHIVFACYYQAVLLTEASEASVCCSGIDIIFIQGMYSLFM